jgi:hypothetical protein
LEIGKKEPADRFGEKKKEEIKVKSLKLTFSWVSFTEEIGLQSTFSSLKK